MFFRRSVESKIFISDILHVYQQWKLGALTSWSLAYLQKVIEPKVIHRDIKQRFLLGHQALCSTFQIFYDQPSQYIFYKSVLSLLIGILFSRFLLCFWITLNNPIFSIVVMVDYCLHFSFEMGMPFRSYFGPLVA